jgi:hypothetical protein
MKLIPKSKITSRREPIDSVKRTISRNGMDVLYRAKSCWDGQQGLRTNRKRLMRYTYGEQFIDKVEVDGQVMTEGDYWEQQGIIPKKNNLIRKMVRSVMGVYRNQDTDFTAIAIDREEQIAAEMMTVTLQANREANRMNELEMRLLEEFLISGMVFLKESWGWRRNRKDTWSDIVNPEYIFFDGVMQDVRHWDCSIIGQIHDMTFNELTGTFAKNKEDYYKLTEIYKEARDINYLNSHYQNIYSHNYERGDFFTPLDMTMCRVIEVWTKEQKPRYRCHDYLTGEYYKIEENEIGFIRQENEARFKEGLQEGIEKDDIPFIEAEWFIDDYWYYRFITPLGDILQEGETPFDHKEHPYTMKIYPFIDGKPHSLVEDSIDQQKFINELITLYIMMAKHSAKGLLMVPQQLLKDNMMDINDIAEQYAKINGIIVYNARQGIELPQQLSTNVSNFNISELLKLEMGMFDDVTGVTGALQGKDPASGTAASLYAQQVQNASNTLVDILSTFGNFLKEAMIKKVSNINQYYTDERIVNVAGARYGGIKKYLPNLAKDVTFDLIISEGTTTPQYKQLMNSLYLDMYRMGILDKEQLLTFGNFPNADAILEDIKNKSDQIAANQEQIPEQNTVQNQ